MPPSSPAASGAALLRSVAAADPSVAQNFGVGSDDENDGDGTRVPRGRSDGTCSSSEVISALSRGAKWWSASDLVPKRMKVISRSACRYIMRGGDKNTIAKYTYTVIDPVTGEELRYPFGRVCPM